MKVNHSAAQSQLEAKDFSNQPVEKVLSDLKSRASGLTSQEAAKFLAIYGPNEVRTKDEKSAFSLFLSKFYNPLVIMLFIVAIFSIFFGEKVSAIIIIAIAFLSVILSFIQEHSASKNAKKLQEMVKVSATVQRDGIKKEVALSEIVPGDIVELSAGKLVPADLRIIQSKDLFVNQSSLNGESFPVEKDSASQTTKTTSIFDAQNLLFMGSSIASGSGQGVAIITGRQTEFGKITGELTAAKTETAFDQGIKKLTWLLIRFIVVLALFIFLVNALFKGNFVESLLFALAIAVGLTPEMLPMIVTVNLSKGAINMAKKKVIIKELDSIQNFGAMDVLCTDKTGTLTLNDITLVEYTDFAGHKDDEILRLAFINSNFQTGLTNLLEQAIFDYKKFDLKNIRKIDEVPFDFSRRILSVVIDDQGKDKLIAKGAPEEILARSNFYYLGGQILKLEEAQIEKLNQEYDNFSREGFRVLAVAYQEVEKKPSYSQKDEANLIFVGFISFLDPPKPDAAQAIKNLESLGITLKVLSGDNELVTEKICREVGLNTEGILTGTDLEKLNDDEVKHKVETVNVFVRLDPLQKERIVTALKSNNHIVGFLGDGINDSPSIKKADVGISVNNATDIAKETANIILLEKSLIILGDCVKEGRRTFANVIKYIKMGASSNFGNMLSMTGASLFLPFLPMLPPQILLNNFLYDVSQTAIPTDDVDEEYLNHPRPWDIKFIKEFIIYIGPISSIFDFVTFGVMWFFFHASPALFHTGWFVESLCTQVLVVHIIRTHKIPFFESKPSKILLLATLGIVFVALVLPYLPFAASLGFVPLPAIFFLILLGIAVFYLALVQLIKNWFTRRFGFE
ncbi:MAG: magnesium-translocating P-type ATPase [Patescibacteria group bacterium]|jgi:Mg2+-importing ATPase